MMSRAPLLFALATACVTSPSPPPPAPQAPVVASTPDAAVVLADARPTAAVDPCADAAAATLLVPTEHFDLAQDCYPAEPRECTRTAPLRLANCTPGPVRIFIEQYSARGAVEQWIEPVDVLLSHAATVFPLPVPRDGSITYYVQALDFERRPQSNRTKITVTMRDPAREKARAQYCVDIGDAGASSAPPALPAGGTELRVHHTACYGSCPLYTVAVRSDGISVYEGHEFVRLVGRVVGRVSANAVAQLVRRFDAAHGLPKGRHCNSPADSPKTLVTLVRGGRERTLQGRCGLADVDEIATAIEDLAGMAPFVTGSDECASRGLW